ncbi:MAG: hypothetical protein R3310_00255 [Candidatus Competibacteraceae bacterium]|nr:hypothetical protein [Candidatus Competibacteraceae bacterium]
MSNSNRRLKIYQDEAKLRHTTHWDWDYLSAEEYQALMEDQSWRRLADLPAEAARPAEPQPPFPFGKVLTGLLAIIALLILALYLI